MFENIHELYEDLLKANTILVKTPIPKHQSINTNDLKALWSKFQAIFGIIHFSIKTTKELNSISPKSAHREIANILGYNATTTQLLDNIKNLEDFIDTQNKAVNRHLVTISQLKADLVDLTCKNQTLEAANTDLNNKIDSLPENCDHYDQCSETAIENQDPPEKDPNN